MDMGISQKAKAVRRQRWASRARRWSKPQRWQAPSLAHACSAGFATAAVVQKRFFKCKHFLHEKT
jgi:hypothetical protein